MILFDRYKLCKVNADKAFHRMPNRYKKVVLTIMEYFNLMPAYLFISTKDKNITTPKHVFIKWLYEYTPATLEDCAKIFGLQDHSTILKSIERANEIIKKYPVLWESIPKGEPYHKKQGYNKLKKAV